jgi:DNA-binding NtrC family response regulator
MHGFKLKVLVADDSALMHALFADFALGSSIPFELIRADNGQQCAELFAMGGFNLAFIDVNMPEMSGMEAVATARNSGNRAFVTLMSGNSSARRLEIARQLKVYEFLAKPFKAQQVDSILKTYCRVTVPTQALIVDDSATVRRILRKVLDSSIFNIDITEAGDGAAAIDLYENNEFSVVFLDCNMPGLNGLDTLERMLEHDPHVKVIMITGERNEELRRKALDRGAFAFLFKPFHGVNVDRELHALFDLKMPLLSTTEAAA